MRILFIHSGMPIFAKTDFDILSEVHEVRAINFVGPQHGWCQFIKNLPVLWSSVKWADLTFCWFGKLHAFFTVFFSKVLCRKSVVVSGGDEVVNEPDIKYGMFCYWWKKWCPLLVFRYADVILSVSQVNHCETIENARANPKKVRLIYHGFDVQKWQRLGRGSKEPLVLTVGRVTDETFRKKGLDLFVQSAKYLPDVPFLLVGPWEGNAIHRLREIASPNVIFIGGLYGEDLVRMYSRAKVYVQASVHESFGCSVAEAMLCECVPVVSRRAALPEVVGDCGFYVDKLSPKAVAVQIEKALASDFGHEARQRIVREFPLEKRLNDLLAAVNEVMSK